VADLVEALRVEKDARVKERLLAVKLVYDGFTLSRAAEAVGRTKRTVFNWVERFREGGVEALRDRPRSGRPRKASRRRGLTRYMMEATKALEFAFGELEELRKDREALRHRRAEALLSLT
jgi:transposase